VDIIDLKFFECVARVQNMNRAASELNTVQSNVTAKIRSLEHELGVTLFNRHNRGVQLTSFGRLLVPYARQIMNLVVDARKAVSSKAHPAGPLIVGSLETVLAMHLGPSLAAFTMNYPDVDISIRTGTTRELVELVLNYVVEGAFVCGPVRHPDLCTSEIFTEELCIVARRSPASLAKVLEQPQLKEVVLRSGCSYRQRLDELLASMGMVSRRILEFGTLEAIRATVAAGVGITFMPRRLVEDVWGAQVYSLYTVEPSFARVSTLFIRRSDSYISPAQTALLDGLRRKNMAPLVKASSSLGRGLSPPGRR
jgi:LysR family transcriptional regulator, cell division regulator